MLSHNRLLVAILLIIATLLITTNARAAARETLVSPDASWKYLNDGSDQGVAWRYANFDDRNWRTGNAGEAFSRNGRTPFGGRDVIYLRRTFDVKDRSSYVSLNLRLPRTSPAIVYLNGVEVYRNEKGATNPQARLLPSDAKGANLRVLLDPAHVVNGRNVLAVEMRGTKSTSAQSGFALTAASTCTITRGPYFQISRQKSVYVRWNTDVACDSRVAFGLSSSNLNVVSSNSSAVTDHVLKVSGLDSWRRYFYSVGTTSATLVSGSNYRFHTSPDDHHPGVVMRFWALGDAGTGDANATAVRNAYLNFTGSNLTHMIMLLGNNAFHTGSDSEYQSNLFNIYSTSLRQIAVLPTMGEADTDNSTNPPTTIPYFQIFTNPTTNEGGGVASGTEKYFGYNYGIIHIVSIDTQASDLSPNGPMLTWLRQDLQANTFPWLIAYLHHAPYSKGNQDSDADDRMTQVRQNVLPVLEQFGVDLVVGAHSNVYERSFFLNGHYGTSNTLTSSMKKKSTDGRPASQGGQGVYSKPAGAPNMGAVYVTAGSAGKVGSGPLNHPAHFISRAKLGSFMFEVFNNTLDAKFIQSDGVVGDFFRIVKNNIKPTISVTSPSNGATFTRGSTITYSANATDPDTHIQRVIFYEDGVRLFSDYSPPYTFNWTNVPAGTHKLHAQVRDDLGGTTNSSTITITVQ